MFGVSFAEILVVVLVAFVVLGAEDFMKLFRFFKDLRGRIGAIVYQIKTLIEGHDGK